MTSLDFTEEEVKSNVAGKECNNCCSNPVHILKYLLIIFLPIFYKSRAILARNIDKHLEEIIAVETEERNEKKYRAADRGHNLNDLRETKKFQVKYQMTFDCV